MCLPGRHSVPGCPVPPWGPLSRPCAPGGSYSQGSGPQELLGQQAVTWEPTSRTLRRQHRLSRAAGQQQPRQHPHPPPHSASASPTRARPGRGRPARPLITTRPAAIQGMRVPRTTSRGRRARPRSWPAAARCPSWPPVTPIPLWSICPSPPRRSPVNGRVIVTSCAAQDTAGFYSTWRTRAAPGHLPTGATQNH